VENQTGVFVQEDGKYQFHPITLGRNDGRFTEVLSGLNADDSYVVENSFLLKSDLEKSGAAHEH
jgi:membrane fusion protein, heavy metal efflux system